MAPIKYDEKLDSASNLFVAIDRYEDQLFERTKLNKEIEQASGAQKSELVKKIPANNQQVADASKSLDNAFDQVKKYYPTNKVLEDRIDQFENWKKQSEAKVIASSNDDWWHLTFLKFVLSMYKAVNKEETESENPTEVENQKNNSSIPKAEQKLKNHPSDKKPTD